MGGKMSSELILQAPTEIGISINNTPESQLEVLTEKHKNIWYWGHTSCHNDTYSVTKGKGILQQNKDHNIPLQKFDHVEHYSIFYQNQKYLA